ncbi:MAG: cytochrome c oxidase subunit II [Sphingomonadales bacterium]|nr:cytochrome c oxidase subunit II [Sphingomonadales bacterium]
MTVKITGNQWYWTYEYPDHGDLTVISNMLEEEGDQAEGAAFRTDADGPRLLAVDNRLVIPAGVNVRFLVTASDVLHSFAVPAFWTKIDAVPGRLNEGWVRVDRPGVYYGQCSELCGARHAYMPIAVEVLPRDRFAAWVRSQGGSMPGDASADAGVDPATPITEDSEAPVNTDTVPGATEGEVVDQAAVGN